MALEALNRLAKSLQNPDKLETIGGMAVEMIRSKIHRGDGFAPLSAATVNFRGAGRPLQDTSGLRDSITFEKVNDETVSVGTNKPYARIHNNGGVIRAKKEWLFIPSARVRKLQRRFGYSPTDVIKGVRGMGYSVFRKGRTVCYLSKNKTRDKEGRLTRKVHVLYYLKKSVEIPARRFFYLSESDMELLMKEAGVALEQL